MKFLDAQFSTVPENLALEELLLEDCEEGSHGETLYFWESATYCVVVGQSNRVASEVHVDACRSLGIPLYRRRSGGGAVVQGPGCLNFALTLRIMPGGPLSTIAETNRFVLGRIARAVEGVLGETVNVAGSSDLCLGEKKFSGNAQRRRLHALLYHGTILTGLDIGLVEQLLPIPSKQPRYRLNRSHRDFLTNLLLPEGTLREAIRKEWNATEVAGEFSIGRVQELTRDRYALDSWNYRL